MRKYWHGKASFPVAPHLCNLKSNSHKAHVVQLHLFLLSFLLVHLQLSWQRFLHLPLLINQVQALLYHLLLTKSGKEFVIWLKRCLSKKCRDKDFVFQVNNVIHVPFLLMDAKMKNSQDQEVQKRDRKNLICFQGRCSRWKMSTISSMFSLLHGAASEAIMK